jgi:hypothetical protein
MPLKISKIGILLDRLLVGARSVAVANWYAAALKRKSLSKVLSDNACLMNLNYMQLRKIYLTHTFVLDMV